MVRVPGRGSFACSGGVRYTILGLRCGEFPVEIRAG